MELTSWQSGPAAQVAALHELLEVAADHPDSLGFRRAALAWCERHIGADQAAVGGPGDLQLTEHATSSEEVSRVTCRMWQEFEGFAPTLGVLLEAAQVRGSAVQDLEVLDPRARAHRRFYGEVLEPIGARLLAAVPLRVGRSVVGILGLGRARSSSRFGSEQLALMGRAAQVIAMGDALRQRAAGGWGARHLETVSPVQSLREQLSEAEPLTRREREIVELVVMGYTNAQVGLALGTSSNTVRKQLVSIFRKVGAGSRAELVRITLRSA